MAVVGGVLFRVDRACVVAGCQVGVWARNCASYLKRCHRSVGPEADRLMDFVVDVLDAVDEAGSQTLRFASGNEAWGTVEDLAPHHPNFAAG